MIINKDMDDLLNMAPVTSSQDVRGLRKIYDLVEVNLVCHLSRMLAHSHQS